MKIKCYGICSEYCVYCENGECVIHAEKIDSEEEEKNT